MKRRSFPVSYCACLIICTAGLLFSAQHLWAADVPLSRSAAEKATTSAPSTATMALSAEEKTDKSGKYDVNRIGQRSVGRGINIYSLQRERALGEAMASAIDRGTKFVVDPDINDYIRQLALKIVRNSDAEVAFTIKVIDSPDLRIFSLPGGFLYVDKGLIMEVDSEAELAGLMAHEIAHVAARHATRLATRKDAWSILSMPLAYAGPAGMGARQIGPLSLKKFCRESEIEADLLGVEYQYASGYDPQAFVEALEKLQRRENELRARFAKPLAIADKVPLHEQIARAFASYPPADERIQRVQAEISALLPSRNDYVVDTSEFEDVKAKLAWENRPILHRHRPGDGPTRGPELHRHPSQDSQPDQVAGSSPFVTKDRLPSAFSYLPAFP